MDERIKLPKPIYKGSLSVEEAIKQRRTVRSFSSRPLPLNYLGQILWAAQGITGETINFRATPSAGIIYPLDVYAVVGQNAVEGLSEGVYRYIPKDHAVERLTNGDRREEIAKAAFGQSWMAQAPVLLVISAEYDRLAERYGERAVRYAELEAGHVGQNIFLQAEAEGLGAGIVGVSNVSEVNHLLEAPAGEEPLSIIPVGFKEQY
jgi:SagB-type dehydrogenase family enzyme